MVNHPKNQHYVPQFLLKNFISRKGNYIWCYDKLKKKCFETNTSNIASESYFYDWIKGQPEYSLEAELTEIESEAALIISKLVSTKSLVILTSSEKEKLSLFISIQFLRTKNQLERLNHIHEKFSNLLQIPKDIDISIDKLKYSFLSMLSEAKNYVPAFMDKFWYLIKSNKSFLISDNPIVLQNTYNQSTTRGTLGLKSIGVEIYIPLSKDLVLCLLCKDVFNKIKLNAPKDSSLNNFYNQLISNEAISCTTENVENINSLQVLFSERFIISSSNNFWLVEDMLRINPELKNGPRLSLK